MERKYYPVFDGLKLLCAIALVLYHAQNITGEYFENSFNFAFGVFDTQRLTAIFLILSGYFASYALQKLDGIKKKEKGKSILALLRKQIIRFWPIVAITTTIVFGIVSLLKRNLGGWLYDTPFTIKDYIASIFLQSQTGLFFNFQALNGVTWYINALLKCLITLYLISFLPKRIRPFLYISLSAAGYTMYFISSSSLLVPWIGGWSGKAFGGFYLGLLLKPIFDSKKNTIKILMGIFLLAAYAVCVSVWKMPCDFILLTDFLLFSGILCLASLCRLDAKKMIPSIGQCAFYLFLVHVPVIYIMGLLWSLHIVPYKFYTGNRFLILGISLMISILCTFIHEKCRRKS